MKKLLTTITLSALVGTSASNLKPVFTNNVINHGFKSNQLKKNLTMINSPFISDFQDLKNKKIQKIIIAQIGQYMQKVAQLVYEKVLMALISNK